MASPRTALAQTSYIWGGPGSTTTTTAYGLATNWTPGVPAPPPVAAGQAAVFSATGNAAIAVAAPIAPDQWTFNADAKAFAITGAAVTFGGAGIIDGAPAAESIANAIGGTGGVQVIGGGTLTLSGVDAATGNTIVNTGSTLTFTNAAGFSNAATLIVGQQNGPTPSQGTVSTTTAAGLTNTGIVFANRGAVNGLIYNTGPAGQFDVYGAVTSDAAFSNGAGASLNVAPAGSYTIADALNNAGAVNNQGVLTAGNIVNTGTVATNGTLGTTTAAGLTNLGTVFANGGAINGPIYNTGPTGQFDVYGAVTTNSVFSNGGGAQLNVAPAGTYAIAGTLNNAGTVNNRGGLTAANIVNTGTVTTTGTLGTTTAAGLANFGTVFANGGAVNGLIYNTGPAGQFDVYGAVTSNAAFANGTGASLNVAPAGAYAVASALSNAGSVGNRGVLTAANIVNTGNGVITSTGTLGTTTAAGLANFGTVFANGGAVNGLIYNTGLTGQFDVYGAVTSNAAFSNGSDAALNVAPAGSYTVANALNNAGTVGNRGVLTAGNIINTGILTTTGTLATTTAAGLTNLGLVFANGGAVNGPIFNAGSAKFEVFGAVTSDQSFNNAGNAALILAPGTSYTLAGALNNASLTAVNAASTLTAGGIGNFSPGIIETRGTLATTGAAGLTNTGTVYADGGQVNGLIYNTGPGQFDVYGAVTSNAAVSNGAGASLNVATGAAYTIAGAALNNGGTTTLAAAGALTAGAIVNTGTIVTAGTLTATTAAGLTNSGTVFANGGTVNGPVYNVGPGQFDVFGAVTDDSFANGVGASLNVAPAASYTIADTLNNAGLVTVGSAGALTTGNIVNGSTGVVTTAGTLTATGAAGLTNFGTVDVAGGAVNGLIYNTGSTAAFNVFGTATSNADFSNGAGASLNLAPAAGYTIAKALNNSGTVLLADSGGLAGVSTLTINGNYVASGAAKLAVGIDLKQGEQSSSLLHVLGATSGATLVDFSPSASAGASTLTPGTLTFTGGGLLKTPLTVVQVDGGGNGTFTAQNTQVINGQNVFGTNGGLVQYVLQPATQVAGQPETFQIVSGVNVAAVTPVATAISTTLGAITTNFFQSSSAFVVPASGNGPDQPTFGPWIRVSGGETTIDSTGTESLLGTTAKSKVDTTFEGFQAGFDSGVINVRGSDTNVHVGITTGIVGAESTEQLKVNQTTSVDFSLPFLGVYAAVKHDAFSADVTYRHDFGDLTVKTMIANPSPTHISADGDSVYGNLLYAVGAGGFSILPSLGLGFSHYDVGNLPIVGGGNLSFNNVDSILGRLGVQVGRSVPINDKLVVQPFVTGAVWHEFEGNTIARFTDASGLFDQVSSTRVGTFGQVGVGMTAQLLPVGFTGFVRGDFRFGDKLNGETGTLGVRYSF